MKWLLIIMMMKAGGAAAPSTERRLVGNIAPIEEMASQLLMRLDAGVPAEALDVREIPEEHPAFPGCDGVRRRLTFSGSMGATPEQEIRSIEISGEGFTLACAGAAQPIAGRVKISLRRERPSWVEGDRQDIQIAEAAWAQLP